MSLNNGNVIGLLSDNLKKRKSVFPVSKRKLARWAKGLDIPFGGETIIYTGSMYQLVPYIESSVKMMEKFEKSSSNGLLKLGRFANKFINVPKFSSIVTNKKLAPYFTVLRNIALLLQKAGVSFGYLYHKELYSGTLVYDLGMDDVFFDHAWKVYRLLKNNKVKNIITVDPHTTDIFKHVYPTMIKDFERFSIKSYIEVLAEKNMPVINKDDSEIAIHDSCVYARYQNIVSEPRDLLKKAGIKIQEPENSGRMTLCCGGPLESLSPAGSLKVSTKRIKQFSEIGAKKIVTMCPVCFASLQRGAKDGMEIEDISKYLAKTYL